MLKPKTYKVEDSNLALFGTDVEKNIKRAAAATEPAWTNAGKEIGIQIWRIEKFNVKSWPKDQYGSFYSGDSYIVLHTYQKPNAAKFSFNAHFWLGAHTSQDEAGTAAYKTVELDAMLHDEPVQFREVQGSESEQFLSVFPNHQIRIMEGGIGSGFKHVEPEKYEPHLFELKGKKKIRAVQVAVSPASLNSGDSFVLDAGLRVFCWHGKTAGAFQKAQAAILAETINSERSDKCNVRVFEEGQDAAPFWEVLGVKGNPPAVKPANPPADETPFVSKLLRVTDRTSGQMVITEVASGKISKKLLDPVDAFILDIGVQVFVWIGKKADKAEKANGLNVAAEYVKKDKSRDPSTSIVRVLEGGEPEGFLRHFTA